MDGCTVNIADYNCRSIKSREGHSLNANTLTFRDLSLFQSQHESEGDRAVVLKDQEDGVYDIGVAREAQRLLHRTVLRPISIQRKAKVLRFRSQAPVHFMASNHDLRLAAEAWTGRSDGPCDPPPAA